MPVPSNPSKGSHANDIDFYANIDYTHIDSFLVVIWFISAWSDEDFLYK